MTDDRHPKIPAILRISRGRFDPAKADEVRAMTERTASYLVPAISALPGLLSYHAAIRDEGEVVHASVWDSEEAALQMATLPEMRERALGEALALGIAFDPIVQFNILWTIDGTDPHPTRRPS